MVSHAGATALGLEGYGIAVGAKADFVARSSPGGGGGGAKGAHGLSRGQGSGAGRESGGVSPAGSELLKLFEPGAFHRQHEHGSAGNNSRLRFDCIP